MLILQFEDKSFSWNDMSKALLAWDVYTELK